VLKVDEYSRPDAVRASSNSGT